MSESFENWEQILKYGFDHRYRFKKENSINIYFQIPHEWRKILSKVFDN